MLLSFLGKQFPLLKLLVPNYAAGAIIGKGGQSIVQIQERYGGKIKLSPSNEYYPGTQERIAVITGELQQLIDINKFVMEKVRVEPQQTGYVFDRDRFKQVKMVVPNSTAGLLIGKGGAMIRSLNEQSKAKIILSNKDQENVPGERLVIITGSPEECEAAANLIIPKVATDNDNMANTTLTYNAGQGQFDKQGGGPMDQGTGGMDPNFTALQSVLNLANKGPQQNLLASLGLGNAGPLGGALGGPMGGGMGGPNLLRSGGMGGMGPGAMNMMQQSALNPPHLPHIKTNVTVEMQIPDQIVGALLGKGGKTIYEFIQYSGAKIQFSGKGDYVPGTNDRILTIQGDWTCAQVAHFLICQKIVQAELDLGGK